jgi:hypothetical protein
VSVVMQKLEAPLMFETKDRDKLMIWKYCNYCELITPIGKARSNVEEFVIFKVYFKFILKVISIFLLTNTR